MPIGRTLLQLRSVISVFCTVKDSYLSVIGDGPGNKRWLKVTNKNGG